jgi:hypothetical protein
MLFRNVAYLCYIVYRNVWKNSVKFFLCLYNYALLIEGFWRDELRLEPFLGATYI